MAFLTQLIISTIAVLLTSYLLPGVKVDGPLTAFLVAAVLSFLNAIVKPFMIVFTIPVTVFTFGLFLFVINAFIILLADSLVDGFQVKNFWWALIFSLLLGLITSIVENVKEANQRNS